MRDIDQYIRKQENLNWQSTTRMLDLANMLGDDQSLRVQQNLYLQSTAGKLDKYFGDYVCWVRNVHIGAIENCNFKQNRTKFIDGLEKTLADGLPQRKGVTRDHLREMIELARGDWSCVETIQGLYYRYSEIREKNYDVEKLFERVA